jgi:hypothetical protein
MASNTYPSGGYSRIFPAVTGAPKATVTGTTGSPTINTVARAGKTIYTFTGSGSITIGQAGTCEVFLAGGGGSGTFSGPVVGSTAPSGGAGGYLYTVDAYLPSGVLTVTVGAGGAAAGNVGNGSLIGTQYYASGGGGAGAFLSSTTNPGSARGAGGSGAGGFGGSGTGSSGVSMTGGAAIGGGIGFAGGNGFYVSAGSTSNAAGGGGGAGGVGGNASSGVNGTAGAGLANSITGSSVTYCAGQAGGSGTSGTVNTGQAGGGTNGTPTGGSGVVIVVVG